VVAIDHKRRICTSLHDKKCFNHGFHHGILVRGCNCDRGDNRQLQEKITDGTNYIGYNLYYILYRIKYI